MSKRNSIEVIVNNSSPSSESFSNKIYVSPGITSAIRSKYLRIKEFVFLWSESSALEANFIHLNFSQRKCLNLLPGDKALISSYSLSSYDSEITLMLLEVELQSKIEYKISSEVISSFVRKALSGHFLANGQRFSLKIENQVLFFFVTMVETKNLTDFVPGETFGIFEPALLAEHSVIEYKSVSFQLKIADANFRRTSSLLKPQWNFERLGIGGLDSEFTDIFRRAFASRVFPSSVVEKLGIKHVKGILLHGPPGTGKTLIARQIGKMLNAREPKIISGPEIYSKYVGDSEKNIRDLFADAEAEYKAKGDESELHILIFDEMDSICRKRGTISDNSGVSDSVVNQLLAKIDGVDALNNLLIIGMTNKLELIDSALLRPGRFEVHVEIGLPDENGRLQILKIHTNQMTTSDILAKDVNLNELATLTQNFSGAEIEGLVRSATSFALNRQVKHDGTSTVESIKVQMNDFLHALTEVKPAFGSTDQLGKFIPKIFLDWGTELFTLKQQVRLFLTQVRNSDLTPLVSLLLTGVEGCGKSAFAATIAAKSDFPYVRIISPDDYVGLSENAKLEKLVTVFENAYKSVLSVIVIDDLEHILEFVPLGMRFSSATLQAISVLLRRPPPKNRKLFLLCTSSNLELMERLGLLSCFSLNLEMPVLRNKNDICRVLSKLAGFSTDDLNLIEREFIIPKEGIAIKKLLLVTEAAKSASSEDSLGQRFLDYFEFLKK